MDSLARVRAIILEVDRLARTFEPPPPPRVADKLIAPDPIMETHMSQFGPLPSSQYTHPEQYDAVLRWHLNMAPAVDPHEQARRMHQHLSQTLKRDL